MDISTLPDNVLMQILRYLPFEQYIRIGGVNKSFRRVSLVVISRTKTLDFVYRDPLTQKIPNGRHPPKLIPDADALAGILRLCHGHLESITFGYREDPALVATLATFACQNLAYLDIGSAAIGFEILDSLLRNNSNLKTLCLNQSFGLPWSAGNYPDVVCPKLETINTYICYEMHIRSIANRHPSLKHFKTCMPIRVTPQAWDSMFAYCRNLETFHFSFGYGCPLSLNLTPSAPFWDLRSLRVLGLNTYGHNVDEDNILLHISASFPNLEVLYIYTTNGLSSFSLSALGNLRNLRKLSIAVIFSHEDEGISKLANCVQLQELYLHAPVSSITFLKLIRSCPRLRTFHVGDIWDTDSNDAALALIQAVGEISLTRLTKLYVRLLLYNGYQVYYDVWISKGAKDALSGLKVDGQMVEFDVKYNRAHSDSPVWPWWERMN